MHSVTVTFQEKKNVENLHRLYFYSGSSLVSPKLTNAQYIYCNSNDIKDKN